MKKIISVALALCLCITLSVEPVSAATIKVTSVKQVNYDSLNIEWSGGGKATVYRAASKNGTYKKVATVSSKTYTDKKIKQNTTYYYKVKSKGITSNTKSGKIKTTVSLSDIPAYSGKPYIAVNNNKPTFSKYEMSRKGFETYSKLDRYGRAGMAYAKVGKETMPTEERGSIGSVKPTGWHTVKYDIVDGKYLYNRCHIIGYQLTGENANKQNLITGTRYMNIDGMLPFENMVADYVKETKNHVLYRATPIYDTNDLLARGVQMEAYSVEDKGEGIYYNVFVYNVQPGIHIDYFTGDSYQEKTDKPSTDKPTTPTTPSKPTTPTVTPSQPSTGGNYVLNTSTKKFHVSSCSSVKQMSAANKAYSTESRSTIISKGYSPCKRCNP